ncbi:MAG: glycosyltransferase [Thioploca sp.]|nr:glycosyltransferase [Thioploca sp.]
MTISPRILLSAYQCAPKTEAVSQIGWQWYFRLAQRVPVTLVTHVRNYSYLMQAGAPLAHSEIIFIDTEWFAKYLYNLSRKLFPQSENAVYLLSSLDFFVYDWFAVQQLKKRQRAGANWDIVHVVTPVSPVTVTRLHTLQRPIILGPRNGGLKNPPDFPEIMKEDSSWIYPLRNLGYFIDFLIGSSRNAAVILTATQATLQSISPRYHSRCRPLLENGVDLNLFSPAPWPPPPSLIQPLRIVFVGRLVPFKGVPLLLEALAQLKDKFPLLLTIIGEGPLQKKWQTQSEQLHLNKIVTWYGTASRTQVVAQIQAAHVLCLPSVRESGGAVLLEAMACARPVIAIAFGGPAEIVDDTVGHTIPPHGGATVVVEALTKCFQDIFEQPQVWQQRGEMGRRRAEQRYSWDSKIDQALVLYEELLKDADRK